jgi:protein-S-isoprenylcysteine O-methyltransferase Ste14
VTLFRPAKSRSARRNIAWTLAQSIVLWVLTLGAVPMLLQASERELGISGFQFCGRVLLGALLFAAFSVLNLMTGFVLAARGRGTPLPTACPQLLVVEGPYRYVRNPMAIAGIGQGVAVAIWLGSLAVLLYAVAGAFLWHLMIRPAEERDLLGRFGRSYERYRSVVPLWWPRWPRYSLPIS